MSAVLTLKNLVRTYRPEVIFLYETLVLASKIEEVRRRIRFYCCFAVDRDDRGGGVGILWRSSIKYEITNSSLHHINVDVDDPVKGKWRMTGFYGFPQRTRRRESWALLRRIAGMSQAPWCIVGNFNDLLSPTDKLGRCDHPSYLMRGFRNVINNACLIDFPLEGYPFT